MSEAATPEGGSLSVEQAVQVMRAQREAPAEAEAPEAPVEAAEEPEEIEAEASPAEEPEAEEQVPAEEVEAEAEAEPVVAAEPPKYWSKDAKAEFAKLTPDLQAVVLAQEGPREEAAAKAKAEAAARVAEATAEVQKVTQLAEQLGEFLPQAIETFASRWGSDPDWVAFAQEHGAEAMTLAKAQHDAELSQLQKVAAAKEEAEGQAHRAYVKAEFEKLAEIAPDLADPEKGPELRKAVTKYAVESGVDPSSIKHISAAEMLIAHKAKLWDDAQAALKARPKPKPALVASRAAPVRPAAAATGRTSQVRSLEQLNARLDKSGDVMDAVRLLQARRKSG
jgi:hypothetical protein